MRIKLFLLFAFACLVNPAKSQLIKAGNAIEEQKLGKSGLFKQITFKGKRYFICEVDPRQYNITLFNKLQNEAETYSFTTISSLKKKKLLFAMNGGMFEKDFNPVGLFVTDGKTYKPLKTSGGTGNFYDLKPNSVFMIDSNNNPQVVTSENFAAEKYKAEIATQSGPMLVIDRTLNNNFKEASLNINIRNGVGITGKHSVVFVISVNKVDFYEMAQLFRDKLNCDNALYLDGFVSQYFAPELQSAPEPGVPLGVFIAVSRKWRERKMLCLHFHFTQNLISFNP